MLKEKARLAYRRKKEQKQADSEQSGFTKEEVNKAPTTPRCTSNIGDDSNGPQRLSEKVLP